MKNIQNNKEKGFVLIEGILVAVAVVMIGSVGWYVYHSKNEANKSYNSADTTSSNTKIVTTKTSNQKNEATTQPAPTAASTPSSTPKPSSTPTANINHPTNANCPSSGTHFTVYASVSSGTPIYDSNDHATGRTVAYGTAIADVGCWQDTNASKLFKYEYGNGATLTFYHSQDVSMTKL